MTQKKLDQNDDGCTANPNCKGCHGCGEDIYQPEPLDFQGELQALINKHSMENGSNTPDFILASYLMCCLGVFEETNRLREKWYGWVTPEKSKVESAPALALREMLLYRDAVLNSDLPAEGSVADLEQLLKERDAECDRLRDRLEKYEPSPRPKKFT